MFLIFFQFHFVQSPPMAKNEKAKQESRSDKNNSAFLG